MVLVGQGSTICSRPGLHTDRPELKVDDSTKSQARTFTVPAYMSTQGFKRALGPDKSISLTMQTMPICPHNNVRADVVAFHAEQEKYIFKAVRRRSKYVSK